VGSPASFVYFPKELLDPLSERSGEFRESTTVLRYFTRHDFLRPKYLDPVPEDSVVSQLFNVVSQCRVRYVNSVGAHYLEYATERECVVFL